jgi:hypothetical protein
VSKQENPSTEKDSLAETRISYEVIALQNGEGLITVLGKEYESDWFKKMKLKLSSGLVDGGILKVNHGGKTYLAISPGLQGSHGHVIKIDRIYENNGVIIIDAQHITPNSGNLAMNTPILLVSIEKTEQDIKVKWKEIKNT